MPHPHHAPGARPNVTYAFVNTLTPNLDCELSNGMYKQPSNASVLMHNVKNPAWLHYVWRVVAEGAPLDKARCKHAKNADGAGAGLVMLAGSCVERFGSAGSVIQPRSRVGSRSSHGHAHGVPRGGAGAANSDGNYRRPGGGRLRR